MRRKLVVLFLALLMTSTAIVGIFNHRNGTINIASAAEGSGRGDGQGYQPIINYSYVWKKTYNLSMIVKEPNCSKGRAFGTLGEQKAAENISKWMVELLGERNVKVDNISAKWTLRDFLPYHFNLWVSLGKLNKTKVIDEHWIYVKVYNNTTGELYENKSFKISYNKSGVSDCFPLLKSPSYKDKIRIGDTIYYICSEENLSVTTSPTHENDFCIVKFANWTDPYDSWTSGLGSLLIRYNRRFKAFMVVDDFNHTYFMSPSRYDKLSQWFPLLKLEYPRPGYSISKNTWRKIELFIKDKRYDVKLDIYSKWHYDNVNSSNVIGFLEGRDPTRVDIICAHYDCWWNQGTIDEAAETALVLGIAKYMKKLEEEKGIKPEHTVKFIAFGGEELGYRGSLDYIKKYIKTEKEKVRYVINPGNFGHIDSIYLPIGERDFTFCASESWIGRVASRVAHSLEYENRIRDLVGNESRAWGTRVKAKMEAEDGKAFHLSGRVSTPSSSVEAHLEDITEMETITPREMFLNQTINPVDWLTIPS